MQGVRCGAAALVLAVVWLACARAHAQPEPGPAKERTAVEPGEAQAGEAAEIEAGVGPAAASIVPGVLLHGSGHVAAGDLETGLRLFLAEGIGLTLLGLGGLGIWATGGADEAFIPLYSAAWMGTALFTLSWLADIYGSVTGGEGLGTASPPSPPVGAGLGYRYVHDPQFDYRHFAVAEMHLRPGPFRISPSAFVGIDERNERWQLDAAYRLLGARLSAEERGEPNSFVDLQLGGRFHDYHDAGFSFVVGEASMRGRYDLAMLSRTMRGAFVEGSLGYGIQVFDYQAEDRPLGTDANGMLLLRWGMGLYLGRGRPQWGEIFLYYDHRRDGFVGGLGRPLLYGSVLGHVGLEGFWWMSETWGVAGEVQAGAAILTGASLLYRWEGPR